VAVHLSAEALGPTELRLTAAVEDTGPGIAPEAHELIFRHFEQAEAGRASGKGSGLGLAISREFARLLGGDITVRSHPGQGSSFLVTLRCQRTAAVPVPPPATDRRIVGLAEGQPPCRLLVVDDREENRALVRKALTSVGFEVEEASSGEEAVERFAAGHPHGVLMDIRLPGINGHEATRQIRALPGGDAVAVLIVSAAADFDEPEGGETGLADDRISKPFRLGDLFEKLRQLLGVEYRYEEAPAGAASDSPAGAASSVPLDREALAALPAELRDALRVAARNADYDWIEELLGRNDALSPEIRTGLQALARRFDYEGLLRLLA
jgi:CheY-like chemotaxis protein